MTCFIGVWRKHHSLACNLCSMCQTVGHHAGLSVALFAPAWVYEGEGNARSAWRQLDQEFWDSLAAVLPAPKPAVNKLPFASDFNTGFGAALYAQVGGRAYRLQRFWCLFLVSLGFTMLHCWLYSTSDPITQSP